MINKKFLIKNGLPLLLAACIFIGCATGGPGHRDPDAPHGLLTITDIPAEFEGRFATAELDPAFLGDVISGLIVTKAVGDKTAITNGEVTLPLYEKKATSGAYLGYTGNDSLVILFSVPLDGVGGFLGVATTFVFKEKVNFENGVAKASFKNSVKSQSILTITITGIPSEYLDKNDDARIQIALTTSSSYAGLTKLPKGTFIRNFQGPVFDGITFVLNDRGLLSYSIPKDTRSSGSSGLYYTGGPIEVGIYAYTEDTVDVIVFRGVVFTDDGKATVDFQQGVKLRQLPLVAPVK
jgi:hypothetical protein